METENNGNPNETGIGTDGDDYINPEGRGNIKTGAGNDIVVISEGDFFNIEGIGIPDENIPQANLERMNTVLGAIGWDKLQVELDNDQVLMFIDPEKEDVQEVQTFTRGYTTYIQIYDKEQGKVVAGVRVPSLEQDYDIKVVGENGNLGVEPVELDSGKGAAAGYIRDMITRGEVNSDRSLLDNLAESVVDRGAGERTMEIVDALGKEAKGLVR